MRYLALVASLAALLLVSVAGLKFSLEHHAASPTSGLQGALAAAPVDFLLVGSSHTRQSYDARMLEELTGASVFLVAYNGLDYAGMVPLVETLLADPARRPRMLVIEGYGISLARPTDLQDPRLFFDSPPALKLKLMRRYLSDGATADRVFDLVDLVLNRNSELLLMHPIHSRLVARLSHRGGYVGKVVPGLGTLGGLAVPAPAAEPLPAQLEALSTLKLLADQAGVPVRFVESPLPGPVERQPGIRALKSALGRVVSDLGAEYLDGSASFPIDEARYFADSNHLSTEGRALFTRLVASHLRAAPRSVDIAPERPR